MQKTILQEIWSFCRNILQTIDFQSNSSIVVHSKGMAGASKMLWKKYTSQRVVKYYISVILAFVIRELPVHTLALSGYIGPYSYIKCKEFIARKMKCLLEYFYSQLIFCQTAALKLITRLWEFSYQHWYNACAVEELWSVSYV